MFLIILSGLLFILDVSYKRTQVRFFFRNSLQKSFPTAADIVDDHKCKEHESDDVLGKSETDKFLKY